MFCWKCGKEIDSSSKFCPYCGSKMQPLPGSQEQPRQSQEPRQEQSSHEEQPRQEQTSREEQPSRQEWQSDRGRYSQTTSAPQGGAQNAPKKGKALTAAGIVLIILVAIIGRFGGTAIGKKMAGSFEGSSSSQSVSAGNEAAAAADEAEATEAAGGDAAEAAEDASGTGSGTDTVYEPDLLYDRTLFQDAGEGRYLYVTVFYGHRTGIVKAITVEHVYSKAAGFTLDLLQEQDLAKNFPASAETYYAEDEEAVFFVSKMLDTDTPEGMQALVEMGLITPLDDNGTLPEYLYSENICEPLQQEGWTEKSAGDTYYDRLDRTLLLPVDSPDNLVPGRSDGQRYAVIRKESVSCITYRVLYYTDGDHHMTGVTELRFYPKDGNILQGLLY